MTRRFRNPKPILTTLKYILVIALIIGGVWYAYPYIVGRTNTYDNNVQEPQQQSSCLQIVTTNVVKGTLTDTISGTIKSNCDYRCTANLNLYAYDKNNNLIKSPPGLPLGDYSQRYIEIMSISPGETQTYTMTFNRAEAANMARIISHKEPDPNIYSRYTVGAKVGFIWPN